MLLTTVKESSCCDAILSGYNSETWPSAGSQDGGVRRLSSDDRKVMMVLGIRSLAGQGNVFCGTR